jgi:hypothetical protein
MRGGSTLYILAVGLLSSGCTLIGDGVRVAWRDLVEAVDDHREHWRNRNWAEAAWVEVSCAAIVQEHSDDYAEGFKDGFTAYLDHGGDGEPPLVAPARYRRFRYQTPQGYRAIEDWFAGYRHGVAVARQTGYRRLITGPVGPPSLPPPPPAPHGPGTAVDQGPPAGPAPTEILPVPRILPPTPSDAPDEPTPEQRLLLPRLGSPDAGPPLSQAGMRDSGEPCPVEPSDQDPSREAGPAAPAERRFEPPVRNPVAPPPPPAGPQGPGIAIDQGPPAVPAPIEILPVHGTLPPRPGDEPGQPAVEPPLPAPRLGSLAIAPPLARTGEPDSGESSPAEPSDQDPSRERGPAATPEHRLEPPVLNPVAAPPPPPPLAVPHGPGSAVDQGPPAGPVLLEILPVHGTLPPRPGDEVGQPAMEPPLPASRLGSLVIAPPLTRTGQRDSGKPSAAEPSDRNPSREAGPAAPAERRVEPPVRSPVAPPPPPAGSHGPGSAIDRGPPPAPAPIEMLPVDGTLPLRPTDELGQPAVEPLLMAPRLGSLDAASPPSEAGDHDSGEPSPLEPWD